MKLDFLTLCTFYFIFCLMGWIWESIYESILNKKVINRGFLYGPYIPIYGVGGLLILVLFQRFQAPFLSTRTIIIYLIGAVGATILEYSVSVFLEKRLNAKWWDYSNYPFNYQGRICLIATLFWGAVAVGAIDFLNPWLYSKIMLIPYNYRAIYVTVMTILIFSDTGYTIRSIRNNDSEANRNMIIVKEEEL
ncbi:MAG: putative ABC transporter permease [Lachnospiraceae bacterium]|nr:putative ABC transporter permease [Lachnospiraceae bacterium]